MAGKLSSERLEDVRLLFRNFSGKEGQFNAKGDRNTNVTVPTEQAIRMERLGWAIKWLEPREEGDERQAILKVKLKMDGGGKPPRVVMISQGANGDRRNNLDEDGVSILDWATIRHVDMKIRPYEWDIRGQQGVTAYIESIYVTIEMDELEEKYADIPEAGDAAGARYTDDTPFD